MRFTEFISETKPGLWANIHAKRDRIKNGSGEHMRKPGSKGAPTADALRKELSADTDNQPEDAPESDLAAMASSEEKRKAAQRAAWIKKLQAKRPIK